MHNRYPAIQFIVLFALAVLFSACNDTTSPGGQDATTNQLRNDIITLTNVERTSRELIALVSSDQITAVAQAHARDMSERDFFEHINPDGEDPFDRLTAGGVTYGYAGENIAFFSATSDLAERVVTGWMNSPGHRANILEKNYRKIGIGVYQNTDASTFYFVQVFTD